MFNGDKNNYLSFKYMYFIQAYTITMNIQSIYH